jgi:YgiT-type zinc finger domain-containing protein
MNCFVCKGTVRDGLSTFTAEIDNCVIIIKSVPSQVCEQCGEASYSDEVTRRLEQIVRSLTAAQRAEIAVVRYTAAA